MALFGMFGKKKPLFAPGSGPESEPIAQPQGIFNGGKFTGRDALGLALGAIGDGLAQNSGGQAIVAPMLMSRLNQRQEDERAEKIYQRRRTDALDDWRAKEDYERTNPAQTAFQKELIAAGIDPASPQGRALLNQKIQSTVDPEIVVPLPQGTFVGPRSQLPTMFGGGGASPQPAPTPQQPPPPTREEWGRFVQSLRPDLQAGAWQEFERMQGGNNVPSGSPLNPNLGGSPPRISSQDEYNRLPSGTEFIAPDGSRRRKP